MRETTIYCSSVVKDLWPSPLADRWAAEYPQLFDVDDIRLTRLQTRYHFVEWFAAIHLFQRDGVRSLVEKYVFGTHPTKRILLGELLTEQQSDALREIRKSIGVQPPDLLLYAAGRLVGFAEVKGPGDRLREKQLESHRVIRRRLRVPVEIVTVKLVSGPRSLARVAADRALVPIGVMRPRHR